MATALQLAQRRLRTLLADEDYGPKLARLRGADERRVLGLVYQGRGREARAEINRLDEARRMRVRTERRRQLLERAVTHTVDVHRRHYAVDPARARARLGDATDAELRFAAAATRDQLVDRAREPPRILAARETNPFWYH